MKNQATKARLAIIAIVVVVVAGLAFIVWRKSRGPGPTNDVIDFSKINQGSPSGSDTPSPSPSGTPSPSTTETATSSPSPTLEASGSTAVASPSPPDSSATNNVRLGNSFVGTVNLIIPVAGVKPDQLLDTFADARSEGRVHDAIDIPAAAGTAVLAVADGEIAKLFQSERGGTTIYQSSADKKLMYYYAHLQGYADGLAAGKFVRQGEVIGYVGDTGNAGAGNYHLHFSIAVVADPKRYWEGTNINPYPLLRK